MVNYNKSIVYKLCCKDPDITDIYIGSTTDFTKRKWSHKSKCKLSDINVYKFIREHGNWNNWDMVQVEAYKAENKRDLESRERHWIETLKSSLNKNIPSQTRTEYLVKYNEINKETIAKYKTDWYQINKEQITKYSSEYRKNNKTLINEKSSIRYQKNKEKINEKVVCECGFEGSKTHLNRHKKSKKHLK